MREDQLDAVLALECSAHASSWSREHFLDCLRSGYHAQCWMDGDALLGFVVAMSGVDEAHLLDLAIAPRYQRQGWGRVLLNAVDAWACDTGAYNIWLEVRASNTRAIHVYRTHGYRSVGIRKAYYPCPDGSMEDAIVMNLHLYPVTP
ncbi:ribosomal-protein-alanine N-acetyltransferase [Candidatus Symbiobacter mobilis CR]|uniref:[Ribosomal protein bS18]-alanine N-acetyltransferase n=2 Tax=Candidatus Symbiobacter TaxID=1436289 RepID=U5N8R2_9BURK|nr:ribosomal-protein-alanine N-acetyltransferase [Candidatus Symbiobacter mobilis CR]